MQLQMQMQMQTFGLLCVHVHTYAHTHHGCSVRLSYTIQWFALLCLATWCTNRPKHTPVSYTHLTLPTNREV